MSKLRTTLMLGVVVIAVVGAAAGIFVVERDAPGAWRSLVVVDAVEGVVVDGVTEREGAVDEERRSLRRHDAPAHLGEAPREKRRCLFDDEEVRSVKGDEVVAVVVIVVVVRDFAEAHEGVHLVDVSVHVFFEAPRVADIDVGGIVDRSSGGNDEDDNAPGNVGRRSNGRVDVPESSGSTIGCCGIARAGR